jgi:hypothetical protein
MRRNSNEATVHRDPSSAKVVGRTSSEFITAHLVTYVKVGTGPPLAGVVGGDERASGFAGARVGARGAEVAEGVEGGDRPRKNLAGGFAVKGVGRVGGWGGEEVR